MATKKLSCLILGVLVGSVILQSVGTVSAETVDTSLVNPTTLPVAPNFVPQSFKNCTDLRSKITDYMELYNSKYPQPTPMYYGGGIRKWMDDVMVAPPTAQSAPGTLSTPTTGEATGMGGSSDYSATNTRTIGVDEPEKVKTDGKFLYTSRPEDHAIYINRADDSLELLSKIVLPNEYSTAELFVDGNRLIIVAQKWFWSESFRNFWIDRSNKSIVITYDIANRSKPVIERYTQIDGYMKEARLVNGQLTLVTNAAFTYPYATWGGGIRPMDSGASTNASSANAKKALPAFSSQTVLPKRIEFTARKNSANVNATIQSARNLGRLVEKDASSCANVEYILPDAETLDNYNFTPSFTAITQLNTRNAAATSVTSLLFGDVGKVYLSQTGKLYLTSTLYTQSNSRCPPGAYCIMPWIEPGTQTVIQQFDATGVKAKYLRTGLVTGNLISDYAIDEAANGQLRLVTQKTWFSNQGSVLTILNSSFGKVGELSDLGVGENFQSARFIGSRLYLVTFKQMDPLFVIDLSDSANPKVLGELKIPGYSTYLHPYDDNRLIGIGYDTVTNQWGGTQNGGLKIDLYNVSDVSKPIQEGSLVLGGAGSYSEALSNPRLFVWQKSKNTLYLPAQLYTSNDKQNPYSYTDSFQGIIAISINPVDSSGVVREIARSTQLEWDDAALTAARDKECLKYVPTTPVCRKLISGDEVCTPGQGYTYVPNYCYADAGLGAYKATLFWNQSERFIDRVLYAGNRVFTFSRAKIESLDSTNALARMGMVKLPIIMTPPILYYDKPMIEPGVPLSGSTSGSTSSGPVLPPSSK